MAQKPREVSKYVSRVALVIPGLEMLNHYKGILLNMPRDSVIVLGSWNAPEKTDGVLTFAREHGYIAMSGKRAYESGMKFSVMVTHHPFVFEQNNPKLVELGDVHVRLMYGLGKSGWNFQPWNKIYHTALCWGPHHAEKLAQYPKIQLKQIGYPRFDSYYDGSLDREKLLQEMGCDPGKPTVAWLPTWGELSSVEHYSDAIAELKDGYNLLVKLHPGCYSNDKQMEAIRKHDIPLLADTSINNVKLFYVADYVLADYGGSPFGAIYTGKKLLLLNATGALDHQHVGEDSLDQKLREWVLNIDLENRFDIRKILENDAGWENQMSRYEEASSYFFSPNYGTSSQVAANEMCDVLLRNKDAFEEMAKTNPAI